MTKLSIFLLLADSLEKVSKVFLGIGIFSTILLAVALILIAFIYTEDSSYKDSLSDCIHKHAVKIVVILFVTTFGWYFLFSVIPSKKTMYMIAGVEFANTVMQTDDYQKAKKYLGDSGILMLEDIKSIIHAEAKKFTVRKKDD